MKKGVFKFSLGLLIIVINIVEGRSFNVS